MSNTTRAPFKWAGAGPFRRVRVLTGRNAEVQNLVSAGMPITALLVMLSRMGDQ